MIEVMYNVPPRFQGSDLESGAPTKDFKVVQRRDFTLSREEHMMKELSLVRTGKRIPRRSQTHCNYLLPSPPPTVALQSIPQSPQFPDDISDLSSSCSSDDASQPPSPVPELASQQQRAPRRPALGPPRRSYSVMDCEPMPQIHRLGSRLTLVDLPPELHFAIFDFLDPIDSTCLGLTSKHFYQIHRRMHGTVPLSVRRDGPNELEWAWHFAGAVTLIPNPTTTNTLGDADHHRNALSKLRVRGQAYCRKCGITRCELHKHIQDWIGEDFEYCSVKQKFGPIAAEGSKPFCYMSKPDDPKRCGRHRNRKSKVVLQ